MANENLHIDDFFHEKLEGFESMPDPSAWEAIVSDIEHLAHPIDQSLNQHLSDLTSTPGAGVKTSILVNAAINIHPIDLALHEKLSVLESIPDRHVYQHALHTAHEGKRKKRRFVVWFSLVLLTGLSGLVGRYMIGDPESHAQPYAAKPDETVTGKKREPGSLRNKNDKDLYIEDKQPENSAGIAAPSINVEKRVTNPHQTRGQDFYEAFHGKINGQNQDILTKMNPGDIDGFDENDMNTSSYLANNHSLKKKKFELGSGLPETFKPINIHIARKHLSRLSVNLQMGFANERVAGRQLKADHIHKDAPSVFGKTYSRSANGQIFSVNFGYRLSSRFTVKVGFQHSSTVERSAIDYVVYTQVPVYDTAGVLTGYLTRPTAYYNENVTTTTSSYSVPLQVYARVLELKKFSLWTGLGSDIVLSRSIKGQFFSFDDKSMKSYRSYARNKLSPQLSLMYLYHLNPSIAITGNIQVSYLKDKLNFDSITFIKQELTPSLRLGLLFTPILAAK